VQVAIDAVMDVAAKLTKNHRIFELLPLDVQHDIANKHVVLSGDPVKLSYDFYRTVHRVWGEVGPRIEANRFESLAERMLLGQA